VPVTMTPSDDVSSRSLEDQLREIAEASKPLGQTRVKIGGRTAPTKVRSPKPHDDLVRVMQEVERGEVPKPPEKQLDVDCILDPKIDKCLGAPEKTGLPHTLNTTRVREAIAPAKPNAKACGAEHGATPGEKVKVKLTISGATGRVVSSVAMDEHAGTPLGHCVAEALGAARFPRFQKPSLGVVYPVTM